MSPDPNDRFDREDAPFLSADSPDHSHAKRRPGNHEVHDASVQKIRFRLMVTLFAIVLAVEMGFIMFSGPLIRIYESVTCRKHYREYDPSQIGADGNVDEKLCKINEVQTELAAIQGYMEFFDGLICALMAIPYGLLADRKGRKPVICLCIPAYAINISIVLLVLWFSDTLPLRTVWLGSLAWFFSGGHVVTFAVVWTMMADVTTEDERATIFFRFGVASMAADFISSAISSWLMAMNPWIPLLIGMSMAAVGFLTTLTLPETKHAFKPRAPEPESPIELSRMSSDEDGELHRRKSHDYEDDYNATVDEVPETKPTTKQPPPPTLRARLRMYLSPYVFIFRNRQILLLLVAFLVYRLSRGSSWFLVQYISLRYKWTLARANFLVSFKPALSIPLFLFGIPALKKHFFRSLTAKEKDLRLARLSIVCLAIGTLGIGISPNIEMLIPSLMTQTTGSGFTFLTRSLITTLVKREETARLFTVIEILQSVGNVIASLSITTVFQLGLKIGGFWTGLAWMMTSTAFCGVGLSIWSFRIPPTVIVEDYDAARVHTS
ncbi:hypothetical protein ASPWEDRAFT_32219 [Aspergillus wentii DTO 134E9]|uniref:Major facilitator superfamily (MFS) profile domain-containing protein n=1 Tax=Aspergillus wentii DTO 134E9 TaxID=1073089 RepID=A0A1L9R9Q5_ASPWE|nr:uncharacterized protein ASPWEDRAFT_32219 [Aspergillus wentii DTO 134E9]OJJ31597.1 hypothetical protein ASPWEDRAFT_32219 [Aspergillus wentii DTO 134E9]